MDAFRVILIKQMMLQCPITRSRGWPESVLHIPPMFPLELHGIWIGLV